MREEDRGVSPDVRAAVSRSLQDASASNAALAEAISNEVIKGQAETAEVLAGLELIRQLSLTTSSLIELRERNITGQPQTTEPKAKRSPRRKSRKGLAVASAEPVTTSVHSSESVTQTFADLLVARIDGRLKPDQQTIKKREIIAIVKKKAAINKAIVAEGLSVRQTEYSREEAVNVIARVLTSARKDFDPKRTYTRALLINGLHLNSKVVDDISNAVGFDWSDGKTVDANTALQIRGLAQLEKAPKRKQS